MMTNQQQLLVKRCTKKKSLNRQKTTVCCIILLVLMFTNNYTDIIKAGKKLCPKTNLFEIVDRRRFVTNHEGPYRKQQQQEDQVSEDPKPEVVFGP